MPRYHYTRPCSVWWGSGGLINVKRWFALVSYLRGNVHLTAVLGKTAMLCSLESHHVVLGVRGAGGCLREGHSLLGVAENQWLGQRGGLGGLHGGIFCLWGRRWWSLPKEHREINPITRNLKKPFIMIPIKGFNKNRLIIVKLHSFSLFSWLIFFYYLNSTEVSSERY